MNMQNKARLTAIAAAGGWPCACKVRKKAGSTRAGVRENWKWLNDSMTARFQD